MTTYEVTWLGTVHATLDDPIQVDAVLTPLHAAGDPIVVNVFRHLDGKPAGGVQVGVGHPDRSFVLYFGAPEGGYAVEPGVAPTTADIEFSYGGEPTDYHPAETRITPQRAFDVVRELVATDQRPSNVEWDEQATAVPNDAAAEADDPWGW